LNPFATGAYDGHTNRATRIFLWPINLSWPGFDDSAAYQNCITQLHRRPPLEDIVNPGYWLLAKVKINTKGKSIKT